MNKGNLTAKWLKRFSPVVLAAVVIVLVLLTVPLALTPARVFGGYQTIGQFTVLTPDVIDLSAPGPVIVTMVGVNVNNIDIASITFAGLPVMWWSILPDGTLQLTFDCAKLTLSSGAHTVTFNGRMKDGVPFAGNIAVTVR